MGIEQAGILIGILTFLGGLLAWYKGSVEKEYASRRDWEHVKTNQRELVKSLDFLFKEFDNRFDQINSQMLEIKAMFYASIKKQNEPD